MAAAKAGVQAARQVRADLDGPHPPPRVTLEALEPNVEHGLFPSKSSVGERVVVSVDAFADGHDEIAVGLRYGPAGNVPTEVPMRHLVNDRWVGDFRCDRPGMWEFTVLAWMDRYATWRHDTAIKLDAGQDVELDLEEGAELLESAVRALPEDERAAAQQRVAPAVQALCSGDPSPLQDEALAEWMWTHAPREPLNTWPVQQLWVDRPLARCSAWYEFFPRSTVEGGAEGGHGTLRDAIGRLDHIADMGFDIVYLPPIHPIGRTGRKGPNNDPAGAPGADGSPWAIGATEGGHTAVHPQLGTVDDLVDLVHAARERGMELALDIAFQCSPDHPWVTEHPEWFKHRADGSIRYAENPPKRYEDIYPIDFDSEDWRNLWQALHDVFAFWVERGVTVFRVDNPHTKPFEFWRWVIAELRSEHPELIFLSEAFTRPKVMHRLAKVGFTQSYTYFAWRQERWELEEYFRELSTTAHYFRPNAWPMTPDILTEQLQHGGRPAFYSRAVLAATLCANWGIYGPAFELVENRPVREGSEEFLDSEKYQVRHWDLDQPHTLAPLLRELNRIRREHPALQHDRALHLHPTDSEDLICYSKRADGLEGSDDVVLCVVNLSNTERRSGWVHLEAEGLGLEPGQEIIVRDLLGRDEYRWTVGPNFVELDPGNLPAHVFHVVVPQPVTERAD
jgi:starch synthase (maltosyl-transferring)